MARGARAALQGRAQHRVACSAGNIDDGAERFHLFGREPLRIDPVQPIRLDAADALAHVGLVVREVDDAALAEHEVDVQFFVQAFPELERVLVKRAAFVPQVVRADDGRVASGVAAADPAFFQHRDVGDGVVFGKVVRGREPVPAAADDDRVVAWFRRGIAPEGLPAGVARKRVLEEAEEGEVLHAGDPDPDAMHCSRPALSFKRQNV